MRLQRVIAGFLLIWFTVFAVNFVVSPSFSWSDSYDFPSHEHLSEWSAKAVTESFTYDYRNHQDVMGNIQSYFSEKGWVSFTDALNRARIIDGVIAHEQTVAARMDEPFVISTEVMEEGQPVWYTQGVITVTYSTQDHSIDQVLVVNLKLVLLNTPDSPAQIGIEQLVAYPK